MKALVLEKQRELNVRDIDIQEELGPRDVKIAPRRVGVCGSDVHYFTHGRIGPFVVEQPMVLGHEASGEIVDVGSEVTELKPGDRVCMEPGIPDPNSKASRLGMYNLDPAVRFWATPPIHGCLRETVVHPADFTFKLPENVSYDEGAMVEPLAIGMHAANTAAIKPGDVAVVTGAGTIGMVTALAAVAGGCSKIIMSDIVQPKLDLAASFDGVDTVNVKDTDLKQAVLDATDGWGADIVFEASGAPPAVNSVFDLVCPGGTVVLIGMPVEPVQYDIITAQAKEAVVRHIFRYAHVYPRAIALMASGKIDVKPLITDHFAFEESDKAIMFAENMPPTSVKAMVDLD